MSIKTSLNKQMRTSLSLMFLLNITIIVKTYLKAKQACSENKHRGKTEQGGWSLKNRHSPAAQGTNFPGFRGFQV